MITVSPFIGKDIIDILTAGMYSDPLMTIREYIQNSTDSLDIAVSTGLIQKEKTYIKISIDGKSRTIVIEDNGIGIHEEEVINRLCSLGYSNKESTKSRGYRGIGRLGGLAYCEKLIFETRAKNQNKISVIEFNHRMLTKVIKNEETSLSLVNTLKKCISVSKRSDNNEPKHFFRVIMKDIIPFHNDKLMSYSDILNYISKTMPVPYGNTFKEKDKIASFCNSIFGFSSYSIFLNGNKVYKPYKNAIQVKSNVTSTIKDVELFEFRNRHEMIIAKGWYAITDFMASLPTIEIQRGIRLKQGNILINDEYFLSSYYTEPRFATWHIGEIHVSNELRLNARRDGFEQSDNYEDLIENLVILCKHLSKLCRSYSKNRSSIIVIENLLKQIEGNLSVKLFTDEKQFENHKNSLLIARGKLAKLFDEKIHYSFLKRIRSIDDAIIKLDSTCRYIEDIIDKRTIRHKSAEDIIVDICKLMCSNTRTKENELILATVLKEYGKK